MPIEGITNNGTFSIVMNQFIGSGLIEHHGNCFKKKCISCNRRKLLQLKCVKRFMPTSSSSLSSRNIKILNLVECIRNCSLNGYNDNENEVNSITSFIVENNGLIYFQRNCTLFFLGVETMLLHDAFIGSLENYSHLNYSEICSINEIYHESFTTHKPTRGKFTNIKNMKMKKNRKLLKILKMLDSKQYNDFFNNNISYTSSTHCDSSYQSKNKHLQVVRCSTSSSFHSSTYHTDGEFLMPNYILSINRNSFKKNVFNPITRFKHYNNCEWNRLKYHKCTSKYSLRTTSRKDTNIQKHATDDLICHKCSQKNIVKKNCVPSVVKSQADIRMKITNYNQVPTDEWKYNNFSSAMNAYLDLENKSLLCCKQNKSVSIFKNQNYETEVNDHLSPSCCISKRQIYLKKNYSPKCITKLSTIHEVLKKLGIRPGLPGGSPAWHERIENNNEILQHNEKQKEIEIESTNISPSASTMSQTAVTEYELMNSLMDLNNFPMEKKHNNTSDLCEASHIGNNVEMYNTSPNDLLNGYKSEENSLTPLDITTFENTGKLSFEAPGFCVTLDEETSEGIESSDLVLVSVDIEDSENREGSNLSEIKVGKSELETMSEYNFSNSHFKTNITSIENELNVEEKSQEREKNEKSANDFLKSAEILKEENLRLQTEKKQQLADEFAGSKTLSVIKDEDVSTVFCEENKSVTSSSTEAKIVSDFIPTVASHQNKSISSSQANSELPIYIENFHPYVKKDNINNKISQQIFDEPSSSINLPHSPAGNKNQIFGMSPNNNEEKCTPSISPKKIPQSENTKSPIKSNSAELTKPFIFETILCDKKSHIPIPPPMLESNIPAILPTNICPPRMKHTEDSQNVLLKQLLQNTNSANNTPSTLTQHITKSYPSSNSSIFRTPLPTNIELNSQSTTTSADILTAITTTTSGNVTIKLEELSNEPEAEIKIKTESMDTDDFSDSTSVTVSSTTTSSIELTVSQNTIIPSTGTQQPALNTPGLSQNNMMITKDMKKDSISMLNMSAIASMSTQIRVPSSGMSPIHVEIKKESITEELISPQSRLIDAGDTPNSISGESSAGSSILDPQELKKLKRRQYQAKRRQSQGKDNQNPVPKKRMRKTTKIDEDSCNESYSENIIDKVRECQGTLYFTEPLLTSNYTGCLPFGAGDPTKNFKNWNNGELDGTYGNFILPNKNDKYSSKPVGSSEKITPSSTIPSTTRGFYIDEFPPLNLEDGYEDWRLEIACRDRELESPDSVISHSSPECIMPQYERRYQFLRPIDENGSEPDSEDDERMSKCHSPVLPLIAPLAVKPKINQYFQFNKENCNSKLSSMPIKKTNENNGDNLAANDNINLTLTLNSESEEDVVGVLRNLIAFLKTDTPTSYTVERSTNGIPKNPFGDVTGAIDLQKYVGDNAKHCDHCKKKLSSKAVQKKASDIPLMVRNGSSKDMLFCSYSCYLQMLLLTPITKKRQFPEIISNKNDEPIPPLKKFKISENSSSLIDCDQLLNIKYDENIETSVTTSDRLLLPTTAEKSCKPNDDNSSAFTPKYRRWATNSSLPPVHAFKKVTEKEITDSLFRMGLTIPPITNDDTRECMLCPIKGDGVADGPGRLLNYDVDKWIHLNCALWSEGVFERRCGALCGVDSALKTALTTTCTHCKHGKATVKCFKPRCTSIYHLPCADKAECMFNADKTLFCSAHAQKSDKNKELTTKAVYRRVYIEHDEDRQIASIVQHAELSHQLKNGSLIFISVGHLLPQHLADFHNSQYIYPIGYKAIRLFWSMRNYNKRCRYICSIHDGAGKPEFRILVQEPNEPDLEYRNNSATAVWNNILEPLRKLRQDNNGILFFPDHISGEYLFGLEEPAVVKILENLPGIESLTDYNMKYGKNPLLELPLAVNPSGSARCEPRFRGPPVRRTYTQRTNCIIPKPMLTSPSIFGGGELAGPYSKQFVHPKSSQYKKMKQDWRNHVYLARSKIQGLGLYAARDIEKHTMVIEYIGEIIRSQLADFREKQYEAKNRGIYMFRLDENRVVDATVCGGLARYINHSCNPNCVTEKVEVDREFRIIIFSKQKINRGEELSYDYQFDIEDDSQKIPCLCGAANCKKWMN